ncbi:hypothetical protein ODZ84_04855 [Chryseobacterium fluminis]|uniref:hypothetical protein n=1 Tax=Chryseobacterium fluminis TaxID=2983606 RepID=UPI00225A17C2|nr:hypothetical protein [Chryseobacterium sp. MMS21-Ot14]UZT98905.1 hypothetical protein ODZ84_04855 [Chryseobacterium sp. MMS21-Ot14]
MTENKLLQLGEAKKLGLSIPRTFLISSLKDLKNLDNTKEYITKPITNCIHPIINGESRLMKTSLVDFEKEGFELPDSFPTSLIQEKIEKSFELRIFYIDGVFYVTKIIEPKTSEIDHRVNIALQIEGMRYENYKLPVSIKTKLKKLLKKFELNCASIDMIVSLNGTYFFLEINPTGQFTYHSIFTNTYLEKKIADTLISFYYKK